MERLTIELPSMYADHHVVAVRAALTALPSVGSIYASAAWRKVELDYDASRIDADTIRRALQACGYATDASGMPPVSPRTRLSTEYAVGPGGVEQFVERVSTWGEPMGACPGFEVRQPGEVHPADK